MEPLTSKSDSSPAPAADLVADCELQLLDWGLIDYEEAFTKQLELVENVSAGSGPEVLIFCSHPPVVTLGRGTREGDVFSWQGPLLPVNRGGRATYHGPSQIVVYPILDLARRGRDLHKYMRTLEDAMVAMLGRFGITGEGHAHDDTGVWIGSRKIASIGIGVRRWVSFHGLALNVSQDPSAFRGLKPCGFTAETMISMQEILGSEPNRESVKEALSHELVRRLS